MASGTIKGSFTGTSTANVYPEIRWRSTSNVTANTSSVTAELWFIKVNSYWYPYNLSGYSCGININGSNASTTATIDMRSVNSQRIWTRTVTVAHNADGNKSITISSGGNTGLNLGSVSVSGTAKLDSIPRASDFGTITGNQIGSAVTIAISRASSSFTHDVSMKLGGATVSTTGAGTSASLTPALSTFCGQLPKTTSGSATITLTTKNGNTVVGTKTKTITLYVPTSVVPSISTFNVVEGISGVSAAGLSANTFVQNKSRLDMTSSASGIYGSTIVDYTFSYNGSSQGGTVGRQFMAGNTSGVKEVKVVVTDSRGRKAERKFDVTVLAYVAPRINKFVVYRVNNTDVVKADVSYTVTNINSKGGKWYIDKLLGSTWTLTNSGTMTTTYAANGITVVGTYDVGKSFSFRTNLHDAFGVGATSLANISTAKTLLDLDKDIGIGVGKIRERGVLDVGGDSYFNGTVAVKSRTNNTGDEWLMSFERKSSTNRLALLTTSKEEEHLRLHFYDKNGTWQTNHSFSQGGNVALGGTLNVASDTSLQGSLGVAKHIWSGSTIEAVGAIRGAVEYGSLAYPTGFDSYSGNNWLGKTSRVVQLSARIKNTNAFNGHDAEVHLATLPSGFRPQTEFNAVMQGSVRAVFLMSIRPNGLITLSRYRNDGSAYLTVPAGSWLNCNATFLV